MLIRRGWSQTSAIEASQTPRWRQRCGIPRLIVPSGRHNPELRGGVVAERDLAPPGSDPNRASDLVHLDNIDRSTRDQAPLEQVSQEKWSLALGDLGHARDGRAGARPQSRQTPFSR